MSAQLSDQEIGKILKSVRKLAKLSETEMAKYLEISPEEVALYECGESKICLVDYIRWIHVLGFKY